MLSFRITQDVNYPLQSAISMQLTSTILW